MNTFRPFQIGIVAVFGVLAVIAIVVLTTYQAKKTTQEQAYGSSVVIWGTLPASAFRTEIDEITKRDKAFGVVSYQQIDPASFDYELVNAIAEGRSPDLVLLSSSALVTHRSKLIPITTQTITDSFFKDTFIEGTSIFKLPEGLYGIPFAVDPLVLFWNPTLFASGGLAQAPTTWEEVVANVPKLTKVDDSLNVLQSGLAFGEFVNVRHAKDVLLLLALQTGSKMVTADAERYHVTLNEPISSNLPAPLEVATAFFTDFSNPKSGTRYSWNRAEDQDTLAFLGGTLALYFGRGSEYRDLQDKNANMQINVAKVPQGTNATALRTFGEFYAFAIPKASKNVQGAFAVANVLTSKEVAQALTVSLNLAPVRRDLLAQKDVADANRQVILDSALIARGWLDSGVQKSDAVFKKMVENVVSNVRVTDAVGEAIKSLTLTY